MKVTDFRTGNLLNYDTSEGETLLAKLDWQDFKWLEEDPKGFGLVHTPIPLTEDIMVRFRVVEREDFKPLAFAKREPGERQIDFQYWSNFIDDDYKLHLCPSYGVDWMDNIPVKNIIPKFWFCWYHGGNWFLPIKPIRGASQLRYVHQLQNLYYSLTNMELTLSDPAVEAVTPNNTNTNSH